MQNFLKYIQFHGYIWKYTWLENFSFPKIIFWNPKKKKKIQFFFHFFGFQKNPGKIRILGIQKKGAAFISCQKMSHAFDKIHVLKLFVYLYKYLEKTSFFSVERQSREFHLAAKTCVFERIFLGA